MSRPALRLKNLSRLAGQKCLVDSLSFDFFPGRVYTLIGPSGAGKTSLARLLNRLDEPTAGEILLEDCRTDQILPTELRRKVGYLFQTPHIFPKTVADNIRLAQPAFDSEKIQTLLTQSALPHLKPETEVSNLSTGERQRVALARTLATDPSVLLLDEPTSALDPQTTEAVERLIIDLARNQNLCVIVITHNREQSLRLGGETLLMIEGRLVEHGSPEQVIEQPLTELGRQFRDRRLK